MNKRDAAIKARQGVTAGDLREMLNNARDNLGGMCRINKEVSRRFAWNLFQSVISNVDFDDYVKEAIATNILREFAPDEPRVKQVINADGIPF